MARKRQQPPPTPANPWPTRIAAMGFLVAEVAVLAGAASPFRAPKEAAALGALSLAVMVAVVVSARRRSLVLPRSRLAAALLILPAILAASTLWAASPARAVQSAIITLIWVVGILWMATLTDHERRFIASAAVVGVTLSIFVMLLQLMGVGVFNFAAPFASSRMSLTGLTGNPADLAMASVLLLPFLLVWGEDSPHPRLAFGLAGLFALAALLTQTLTGIGALTAVTLVWLIQKRSRRLWLIVAGVGTVAIAIALAAGLGARLEREAERVRTGNWYRLLSARGDGWTAASEMIRNNPATGVGAANYTHQYYPSRLAWLERNGGTGARGEMASHFQWAHCDPLQAVAELGAAGWLWMLLMIWAVLSGGRRAGPVMPLLAAATVPFLLLHYPSHLAVGLIPMGLGLGHLVAYDRAPATLEWRRFRAPVAGVLVVLAVLGVAWQLRRIAVDVWTGGLELRLAMIRNRDAATRAQRAAAIEAQILPRLDRLGTEQPVVLRTLGRARLVRGEYPGAESAFRASFSAWPHEDAEFFLALSLAGQGRRNEAISHLSRVCRTNPQLMTLISDESLRRAVEDTLAPHLPKQGSQSGETSTGAGGNRNAK